MFSISELMQIQDSLEHTIHDTIHSKYDEELLAKVEKLINDYFEEITSI